MPAALLLFGGEVGLELELWDEAADEAVEEVVVEAVPLRTLGLAEEAA